MPLFQVETWKTGEPPAAAFRWNAALTVAETGEGIISSSGSTKAEAENRLRLQIVMAEVELLYYVGTLPGGHMAARTIPKKNCKPVRKNKNRVV